MIKTLTEQLNAVLNQQRRIILPYIMAGDHEQGLEGLQETIDLLAGAGAAAIEIGVPFSDPVADGPVIEAAGLRSLAKGTTLKAIVSHLKTINSPIPLVLMTYCNPIYQYGIESLVDDLKDTAVRGVIIPDLPFEHENMVAPALEGSEIDLVRLVSLTTGRDRQTTLVKGAKGFIYAVAVNGVTGKQHQYREDLDKHLKALSELASIPVLTGFGVSTLEDVERFNKVSAGVIVGSKIVKDLHEGKTDVVKAFVEAASSAT